MNQETYALLLQDVEGFKVGYVKRLKSVTVEKGSLLIHLDPSVVDTMKKNYDCIVNYGVERVVRNWLRDSLVKNQELVFIDSSLLYYLSKYRRDLLLGVTNPFNRLEVLGRLEWVESLRTGFEVYVTIATITAPVRGIVRYIGNLPGKEGRMFGVELMEGRGRGTHDGCFKGTEFFKCARDCAVFVAMDKLTDGDTVKAARVTPTSDPSSLKPASTDKDGVPIRLGDYVKFYDKMFAKHRGVVRWIGTNKSLLPDGTPIVGIEGETHLNLNDVPLNIKDWLIRDYFTSKKSKVLLPITFVYRDKSNSFKSQEPAHDGSGDLPNSPLEAVKPPQLQSMTRRESDSQLQSLTRRESDTTTAQPQRLNKIPLKHKSQHDYDLLIPQSLINPYNLEVGSAVQYLNQYGVIKWIGCIVDNEDMYAGLEMEDDVKGSGNNGELMGVQYFMCKPGKGKFALLISLKPDERNKKLSGDAQPLEPNPYNLEVGSVIEYGVPIRYGVIKWIGQLPDLEGLHAGVEMDDVINDVYECYDGVWAGIEYYKCKLNRGMFVLLSGLKPGTRDKARDTKEVKPIYSTDVSTWPKEVVSTHKFDIGSRIKHIHRYGVIKWIGKLAGLYDKVYAGVEMEEDVSNPQDGVYCGEQVFKPQPGRGKFLPLSVLQPDDRCVEKHQSNNDSNSLGTNTVVIHQDPTISGSNIEQSKSNHGNESTGVSFIAEKVQQDVEQKICAVEGQMRSCIKRSEENIQRMESNVDNAFKELQVNNAGIQKQLLDMQKNNEWLQASNEHLQSQMLTILDKLSHTQQQLLETHQQMLDMQKSNEQLQKSNELLQKANAHLQDQLSLTKQQMIDTQKNNDLSQANLQNQLSLTQQQLLGVQSMMTCSRLWVVSYDQFKIGREIGRGAWASVHETTFRGAKVAAKRLHDEITSPETIELFHQEMEMALHCQHQNIVTFLGVTLENHPVILMELMDISLRSAYKRGSVKYQQVLKIFYDIASALHFLHTRPDPVIHRDVSTANVLLKDCGNEKWLAKLGDLGTAKLQQYCTTPGPGALAYAAPEVADPKRHSTKMDVYSFGVLVIEVLTKTLPFQNLNALKGRVQQQFPQYHQLVTSCTNQQSSDRPTMYDVIGQLNKIL